MAQTYCSSKEQDGVEIRGLARWRFPVANETKTMPVSVRRPRRETFEEVGLELSCHRYVGRLDDLVAPPSSPASGLVISCFVFSAKGEITLNSNEEVSDTIWIPVTSLTNVRNFLPSFQPEDYTGTFPAIRVAANDSRVIWGLTYRFLRNFFAVCALGQL